MEQDFIKFDVKKLYSSIRHEEKWLRKKRRWLMGLQVYMSSASPKNIIPKFLKDVSLLESVLREDDVSSEAVRTSVERSFGALIVEQEGCYLVQDYRQLFDMNIVNCNTVQQSNTLRTIYSALDDLNNNGLFGLAIIATGNSNKFEKTRPRMKEAIRKHLPTRLRKSNHKDWKDALVQLFADPSNFQQSQLSIRTPVPQSLVSAATMILERLQHMGRVTVEAMYRKLRGIIVVPQIKISQTGFCTGKRLIKRIQLSCYKILSKLSEGDELPIPLAKAMAVAGLWFKQQSGLVDFPIPDFYHFPHEIKALQNQIIMTIQSLEKVSKHKLRHLEPILDPNAKVSRRGFRSCTRRLLTEYLYECGHIDVPKSFLKALTWINKNCGRQLSLSYSRETMEEELECVLDVSSQLRQIIWEILPDHHIDQEFADAYMDDLESDDDGENNDIELDNDRNCSTFDYFSMPFPGNACLGQSNRLQIHLSHHSDDESVGDSRPTVSTLPVSVTKGSGSLHLAEACANFNGNPSEEPKSEQIASPHSIDRHGIVSQSCLEEVMGSQNPPQVALNKCENQYLAMQDICDEASLVAHRLIGRLLEDFLQIEGVNLDTSIISYLKGGASIPEYFQGSGEMQTNSTEDIGGLILIRAVEELVPSIPESGMEQVKELMGLL